MGACTRRIAALSVGIQAIQPAYLTLRRTDPTTQAYIERRTSEGKTIREAVRCLKRYLARSLHRQMETMPTA